MSALENIATRLQVQLEGLKTNSVQDFNPVLEQLSRVLGSALAEREITEMSRRQLETMIKSIRESHESNLDVAIAGLIDVLRDLSGYAYEFESGALLVATTATTVQADSATSALWSRVIKQPMGHDGSLLEPFLDRMSSSQITATENLVRRAFASGWTNRQLLQAFRGTRANRYTDGVQSTLGRASRTVIQTAIQHVNSAARAVVWEQNADVVQGYRIVATLDSRTSKECRSLDGQEFPVGKGPLPPFHLNCRSTTVAVLDPMFDELRGRLTRSAQGGPVPQTMTYYEWLKTQSKDFQYQVLGPTRAALFRDGGLSAEEFARLQLNRFFEPLTLDEMRRLKPLAFDRAGI